MSSVDLVASLNDFAELNHLVQCLLVLLLQLPDDLEGPMLLAEDTIDSFPVDPLHLKEVIGSSGTLDMERDHAPWILALDAGACMFLTTDDAL